MSRNIAEQIDLALRTIVADPGNAAQAAQRARALLPQLAVVQDPRSRPPFSRYDNVPDGGMFVQPLIAPDLWLVVPNIPAVAAAQDSPGEELRLTAFGKGCKLIGWRGTVIDTTAGSFASGPLEQASIGVRCVLNGEQNKITNGEAADFAKFSDLFADATQWSPMLLDLEATDVLSFNFRNFQPAAGGHSLTPSLLFAAIRKR